VWTGHERGISIASNSAYFRSLKIGSLVATGESNDFLTIFRDSKGDLWLGGTNGVIVRKADGNPIAGRRCHKRCIFARLSVKTCSFFPKECCECAKKYVTLHRKFAKRHKI